jgi:hypothetical protein
VTAVPDLTLHVHVPDAEPYEIGEEIWPHSLAEAIDAEASILAEDAGSDLLQALTAACREQLRKPDRRPDDLAQVVGSVFSTTRGERSCSW